MALSFPSVGLLYVSCLAPLYVVFSCLMSLSHMVFRVMFGTLPSSLLQYEGRNKRVLMYPYKSHIVFDDFRRQLHCVTV